MRSSSGSSSIMGGGPLIRARTLEDVLTMADEDDAEQEHSDAGAVSREGEQKLEADAPSASDVRGGRIALARDEARVRRSLSESSRDIWGDDGVDMGERSQGRSSVNRMTPMDLVRMRSNQVLTTVAESDHASSVEDPGEGVSSGARSGVGSGVVNAESPAAEGVSMLERGSGKGDASAAAVAVAAAAAAAVPAAKDDENMSMRTEEEGKGTEEEVVLEPGTNDADAMEVEEQGRRVAPEGELEHEGMNVEDGECGIDNEGCLFHLTPTKGPQARTSVEPLPKSQTSRGGKL